MKQGLYQHSSGKQLIRTSSFLIFLIAGFLVIASVFNVNRVPVNRVNARPDSIEKKTVQNKDSLYRLFTKEGDYLNSQKKYTEALGEYEKALSIKPKDIYVTDKVTKIKSILNALSKANIEYTKAIASGDGYFKDKDFLNAKSAYQVALDYKPDDAYAKGKLQETMDKLRALKATNILYDVTTANAEKLFQSKEYEKAMVEFENASKMLPNEKYPKDRINEIIKIMVDQKTKEEMYGRSIAAADKFYNVKNYQNALLEYQNASSYKPDEQYPRDRINELTALLSSMKSVEEAYKKAISAADKFFNEALYAEARKEYQNASKIKPQEIYPINRIREIDDLLAQMSKTKEQYEKVIALADSLYIGKQYINSRLNYLQALKIRPKEAYPKEMVAKTEKMISEQDATFKQVEESYQALIKKADDFVSSKSYALAKEEYQKALEIKPGEQYPKERINEIISILAGIEKQKALEEQYLNLIASGDKLFDAGTLESARTEYLKASQIKSDEQYPKEKIAQIDQRLAELGKQKALDDQYTATISRADKLMTSKSWDQAKSEYGAASLLKPEENYPKEKITEIEGILSELAKQKELDETYRGIIANADKLFLAKTYPEARAEFVRASGLKPSEEYPKMKVGEIDNILAQLADQKQKEEQYQTLITNADKLLSEKSYDPARTEYQNALAIKPAESYPKTKIAEIGKILDDLGKLKLLEERYQAAISSGDKLLEEKSWAASKVQYQAASALKPEEQYPKDKIALIDIALADLSKQKALDDQYTATISRADKLMTSKSWDQAKSEYGAASLLKPEENYPKEKITEIEGILSELAKQKELEETYRGIIVNADKLFLAKTYPEARAEFVRASGLKPSEEYPKMKVGEIDNILAQLADQKQKEEQYQTLITNADKLLSEKSYDPARTEYQNALAIKPAESYPKTKISEIEKTLAEIAKVKLLEEQYSTLIQNADKLLMEKSFTEAKTEYLSALKLKPAEQYPKDKISEIDKTLAEVAKAKALDDQYSLLIANADKLLSGKSFEPAKTEYLNALKLKPNEEYPKGKISEIEKILAGIQAERAAEEKYQQIISKADQLLSVKSYDPAKTEYNNALAVKPSEQYPKDKIAEIEKIIAEIALRNETEAKYKISIMKADQLFQSKSYELAKNEYQISSTLKPAEEYPKGQISAIDKIFAEKKALDEQYSALISKADLLLSEKSFDLSKVEYSNALKLKPTEKYPKDKIEEIDKAFAELNKQKSIDNQFQNFISKADKLFSEKSYTLAKVEFNNALNVKPGEQYPKEKISEIDGILAEIKVKDDAYKASVTKANQLFNQKSYEESRTEYQNAGSIKPDEQYPKERIAEINKILTDIKGKKQTYDELIVRGNEYFSTKDYYKAKETFQQATVVMPEESYPKGRLTRITAIMDSLYRANKGLYDKAIAEGDKFYTNMTFDKAIDSYTEALAYLPNEAYPREMISKIKKVIAENAIVDVLTTTIIIPKDVDKQFSFSPVSMASRKNNFVYVKIKNLSDKPFNVLIRYGKDKQTSGGAVIKNLAADGKISDRLISVKDQDPWYREDNNWVSLFPQGGDVEVSFIQISRAVQ